MAEQCIYESADPQIHDGELFNNDTYFAILSSHLKKHIFQLARMSNVIHAFSIIDAEVAPKENVSPEMLLSYASAHGKIEAVTDLLMIAHNDRVALNGNSPLYSAALKGYEEIVARLLYAGADKNKINAICETPLYGAVKERNRGVVMQLLRVKADMEQANKEGVTPLARAVLDRNYEMLKLLLIAGANKNTVFSDDDCTLLSKAAENGDKEAVLLLLIAGASADADNKGLTPLYYSLQNNHDEIVRLLKVADLGIPRILQVDVLSPELATFCGYDVLRNGLLLIEFAQRKGHEVLKKIKSEEDMNEIFYRWNVQISRKRLAQKCASELVGKIMKYYKSNDDQELSSDKELQEQLVQISESMCLTELNRTRGNDIYHFNKDHLLDCLRHMLEHSKYNTGELGLANGLADEFDAKFKPFSIEIQLSPEKLEQNLQMMNDRFDAAEIAFLFDKQKLPNVVCLFYGLNVSATEMRTFERLRERIVANEDLAALIMIRTSAFEMIGEHWFVLVIKCTGQRREYFVADSLSCESHY